MQFCPYCNSTNRSGAQFCNTCGRSLPGPSLICSRCRALITETDKFCHTCGARLSEVGRQFHTMSDSSANTNPRTAASDKIGLGSGTFVDAMEPATDDPPAIATPSIPHRLEGSWQLIDSWVSKQGRRDAAPNAAVGQTLSDETGQSGLAILLPGQVSRNQAIGFVAVVLAIAAIIMWLSGRKG